MKIHCLVSKVSTKYNDKSSMHNMKSLKIQTLPVKKREYEISARIGMLLDEKNVVESFWVKSPW